MKNLQYRTAITVFVWITILSFILLYFLINSISFSKFTIDEFKQFIKLIGFVVTIDIILWLIFSKWAWKFKIFQGWLVKYPNLNGVWVGTYKNENNNLSDIKLTIIQSLTKISCKNETKNGISISYVADILYEPGKHYKKLIFSYNYELYSNKENRDHRGTYDFIIEDDGEILKGNYWTNKPSKGTINTLTRSHRSRWDTHMRTTTTKQV